MRAWLVRLIVLATVGFVIGTSIERHNTTHESAAQLRAERAAAHAAKPGGESAATHAAEGGGAETTTTPAPSSEGNESATHAAENQAPAKSEAHKELRPLGVNIEAVPFVVLAAVASLALAALGWARPRWLLGLAAIAVAMVVFGALDVREAFHQSDEKQTGLVILALVIAALHFAAAGIAAALAARRTAPGAAGTIAV
jgi:hypothetical protein